MEVANLYRTSTGGAHCYFNASRSTKRSSGGRSGAKIIIMFGAIEEVGQKIKLSMLPARRTRTIFLWELNVFFYLRLRVFYLQIEKEMSTNRNPFSPPCAGKSSKTFSPLN